VHNSELTKKANNFSNDLFNSISKLIEQGRRYIVHNINYTMIYTNYEIGRMIVEKEQNGKLRAEYGKGVLKDLSVKLNTKYSKGFSVDNLQNMRRFYLVYSKYETLSRKSAQATKIQKDEALLRISQKFRLSWSHYLMLMKIDNEAERSFYEIESAKNNWSVKELERQFDSAIYERLVLSKKKNKVWELAKKGQIVEQPEDLIKEPCVLEFLGLPERAEYSENDLEQKIIDKLQYFLLELGKGFTFVGRQVRFTFDEKHFRVDLVFYNRILKCFVLIDLKLGTLTHQDLGQMQMYVNYYDRFVKLSEENKTVGIILCKSKNKALVEITLPKDNKTIFASKYQTVLPSKTELQKLIESR
jgi:predicted nuclease of restriction endonuclease-like (RecB) superfamily